MRARSLLSCSVFQGTWPLQEPFDVLAADPLRVAPPLDNTALWLEHSVIPFKRKQAEVAAIWLAPRTQECERAWDRSVGGDSQRDSSERSRPHT